MKLVTERSLIRNVHERWLSQYPNPQGDRLRVLLELTDLDRETATAKDVEKIIGNDTWVMPNTCDECGARGKPVVQICEEPDYETHTAWICQACIERALRMFKEAQ